MRQTGRKSAISNNLIIVDLVRNVGDGGGSEAAGRAPTGGVGRVVREGFSRGWSLRVPGRGCGEVVSGSRWRGKSRPQAEPGRN